MLNLHQLLSYAFFITFWLFNTPGNLTFNYFQLRDAPNKRVRHLNMKNNLTITGYDCNIITYSRKTFHMIYKQTDKYTDSQTINAPHFSM